MCASPALRGERGRADLPRQFHHDHEVADARVVAIVERVGHLVAEVGATVVQASVDRVAQHGRTLAAAVDVHVGVGPAVGDAHPVQVDDRVECGVLIARVGGHAMIRHDDQLDATRSDVRALESVEEAAEDRVHLAHGVARFRRLGSEAMAGVVDAAHVERGEVGSLVRGQGQPAQHRVDAIGVRDAPIVGLHARRAQAADIRLRARPEVRGRHHALTLGRHPDRFAVVPGAVAHRERVAHAVARVPSRVEEPVGDEPMVLRVESGDDRVVVGKGLGRKGGDEFVGAYSLGQQAREAGRRIAIEIVVAEAVEREEHDRGRGIVPGVVSAARPARVRRALRREPSGRNGEREHEREGEREREGAPERGAQSRGERGQVLVMRAWSGFHGA